MTRSIIALAFAGATIGAVTSPSAVDLGRPA